MYTTTHLLFWLGIALFMIPMTGAIIYLIYKSFDRHIEKVTKRAIQKYKGE